jgi:hypothetical protein
VHIIIFMVVHVAQPCDMYHTLCECYKSTNGKQGAIYKTMVRSEHSKMVDMVA